MSVTFFFSIFFFQIEPIFVSCRNVKATLFFLNIYIIYYGDVFVGTILQKNKDEKQIDILMTFLPAFFCEIFSFIFFFFWKKKKKKIKNGCSHSAA